MTVPAQLLKAGAAVFVIAMSAHSAGIIHYNRRSFPTATICATCEAPNVRGEMPIKQIVAGGPAERAGLRVGDRIRAVNGQPLHTARASSEPSSLAQVIADRAGGLALILAC